MPKKLTIEFVREEFEKEGYKLLTKEYINAHQKLDYICPGGHKYSIRWNNWKTGSRCFYCYGKIKKTIEFIRSKFEKDNYVLLTKKYKNCGQKLHYVCPNGHKHSISWINWYQGKRCPYCIGQGQPTIDFIKKEFKKEGYTLLTKKYNNNQHKLKCICPNGHKHSVSWNNWNGRNARCPTCYYKEFSIKYSGRDSWNWKGGISCEPYCHEWSFKDFKDMIKERDGNKCLNPDCWRNSRILNVHHIDYNKKNCGTENLITLCTSCNARANFEREWHELWYKAILYRRDLVNTFNKWREINNGN